MESQKTEDKLEAADGIEKIRMVSVTKDGGQISLRDKTPETIPEGLQGKNFTLRTDSGTKDPQVFFAKPGVLAAIQRIGEAGHQNSFTPDELKNWERTTIKNPQIGSKKNVLEKITNIETGKSFIGIPITNNHYGPSNPLSIHESPILLIEEKAFQNNKDFTLRLDHEQLPLVKKGTGWTVDPKSPYAPYVDFKGGMGTTTPQEIYVLSKNELESYGEQGSRKGWQQASNDGVRDKSVLVFEKMVKPEFGSPHKVETRHAKQIIVDGEEKYLISNKENIANLKINKKPKVDKKAEQADQEKGPKETSAKRSNEKEPQMSDLEKAIYDAYKTTVAAIQPKGPEATSLEKKRDKIIAEAHKMPEPNSEKTLSDFANKVSARKIDPELKDLHEKEFLGNISKNIEKTLKEKEEQNQTNATSDKPNSQNGRQQGNQFQGNAGQQKGPSGREQHNNPNQAESMAAGVAGMAAGTVVGTAGAIMNAAKDITGGIGAALGKVVDKHHERKMERLENPELAEQEQAAKREKAQGYRADKANLSNQILDAKMEAAISHRNAINDHPGVQAIHNMVEQDPSKVFAAQEEMIDLINSDGQLKHHHKELMRNVKDVTSSVTDNLEKNSLAGMSLDERKEKISSFNKDLANDPLADTLKEDQDADSKTLRESLAEMASKIAKWLKEFIRNAKNSFSGGPSSEQEQQQAPPAKMSSM